MSSEDLRTHTPLYATGLVIGGVLMLALGFPLATLAEATSIVTLAVFALINAALAPLGSSRQRCPRTSQAHYLPRLTGVAGEGCAFAKASAFF